MTQQERIQKYKKEYCSRCKNKDKYDCEIRVFAIDKTIYTKCVNYEKDETKIEAYKRPIYKTARLQPTVMGLAGSDWS